MCGAESHARYSVEAVSGAVMSFGVGFIVITETLYALEDHVSGLVADCAVCGVGDGLCCFLDGGDGGHVSFAVNEVIDQPFELRKANTAGDTFSASLCGTYFQVTARKV